MPVSGHKFTAPVTQDSDGVITIAELLVVLVVSMILMVAVLSGQRFVQRMAGRFFDRTTLETEGRLLLQALEADLARTEALIARDTNRWELIHWLGDGVVYQFADSLVLRDGVPAHSLEVSVPRFRMWVDTVMDGFSEDWLTDLEQSEITNTLPRIRVGVVAMIVYKGRSQEFRTVQLLRPRFPNR